MPHDVDCMEVWQREIYVSAELNQIMRVSLPVLSKRIAPCRGGNTWDVDALISTKGVSYF